MSATKAPLADFHGERPPAPAWFEAALAQEPERSFFDSDGVDIELLTWGEAGKPGLLFLHGNSAHADWWSFIAPFFAETHRCAAISWSGMGRSGRRDVRYEFTHYAAEALAAIDVAGLDNGSGVMIVAHSAGGYPALLAAAQSDRIRGVISLDSAIVPKELKSDLPKVEVRQHKVYRTIAEALMRFKFMPPKIAGTLYTIDYAARTSLVPVAPGAAGEGDPGGWSWAFDPEIFRDLNRDDTSGWPKAARCPLALILGGESDLISGPMLDFMRSIYPDDAPFITIPEAGHHIMIDQPLALVSVLRTLLITWPARTTPIG